MKADILCEILKDQVTPALGCTEPGAVALAVSKAVETLGEEAEKIDVSVDKNILKNGMNVGIPGTEERGIIFATALAAVAGKSKYMLEALKDASSADIAKAALIAKSDMINLTLDTEAEGLSIKVNILGKNGNRSSVTIKNSHTNIVEISKNGKFLLVENIPSTETKKVKNEIKFEILNFSVKELIEYVKNVPIEELSFIQDGIDMNLRIAQIGMTEDVGVGMSKLMSKRGNTPEINAKAITVAASEARMAGWPLPVMSSAGSGNHGLVAIIPISVIGRTANIPIERIKRAIALSHLVTIFVKVQIGVLSPVCGCAVASGLGCAAGLTFLKTDDYKIIENAICNIAAGITGMICDGAKISCAYKLSISVDAAIDASDMALNGANIPTGDGILGTTVEQTIKNLATVSKEGMNNTDDVILKVLMKC